MDRFKDRGDAGRQLAAALASRLKPETVVLGIPRGGVEVAWEVALRTGCGFSALVVRKLPYPDNPEAGFGAVAEDGTVCMLPEARRDLPRGVIERILAEQKAEARRRVAVLRQGEPLPDLKGREVCLIDDGVAMGSTMLAGVLCCRNLGAAKVTAASPVASVSARQVLTRNADEVVVLLVPPFFRAVAEHYEDWRDVPDAEAAAFLKSRSPHPGRRA
ncbi:MAG: phosphoribosyltransferase [Elusimicrobia bacterium]|nr:phosphoribosyltransferase [Elusimicrobiota bacterium]